VHHLPEYFIGDENEVLALVNEAEEHIAHLQDGEEGQLLRDWIAFKTQDGEECVSILKL